MLKIVVVVVSRLDAYFLDFDELFLVDDLLLGFLADAGVALVVLLELLLLELLLLELLLLELAVLEVPDLRIEASFLRCVDVSTFSIAAISFSRKSASSFSNASILPR